MKGIRNMLSARYCDSELYDPETISKLTLERVKKFRRSMHKNIGHKFWCCEFHCAMVLDTPEKKQQYQTFKENLRRVNKHLYSLKNKE